MKNSISSKRLACLQVKLEWDSLTSPGTAPSKLVIYRIVNDLNLYLGAELGVRVRVQR